MSKENIDLVRRVYAGSPEIRRMLLVGDGLSDHPWLLLWHPECTVEETAEVPDAATYRGRAGVTLFFKQLGEVWDDLDFTPTEVIEGSDGVAAAVTVRGRSKAGVELEASLFQIFRIQEGMVVYATGYLNRDAAAKAVGLAE